MSTTTDPMRRRAARVFRAVVLIVLWAVATSLAAACEIELRPSVVARTGLVRLGDIATVTGLEPAACRNLSAVVVAAAPTPSRSVLLTTSQLRWLLERQGVDMTVCRFGGAERVIVYGSAAQVPPSAAPLPAANRLGTRSGDQPRFDLGDVKRQIVEAVRSQLQHRDAAAAAWEVEVELTRQALWTLPESWQEVSIEGLHPSNHEKQDAAVRFVSHEGVTLVPVRVRVAEPMRFVVARRDLARGDVVTAADVELQHVPGEQRASAAQQLDQVVGWEATRTIAAGQVVDTESITPPILIRRRELVDVVAQEAGIVVRRRAVAAEAGARGDIIQLEAVNDRKTRFSARVTGRKTAAVFVGPALVEAATTLEGR